MMKRMMRQVRLFFSSTDQSVVRLTSEVDRLQAELDLQKLIVKNLVAENTRNFERIKAETAAFSEQVVLSTRQLQSTRGEQ